MTIARRRALASAINTVLPAAQRAEVRALCSAEAGRRCTPLDVMSWMRLNMPSFADKVEDIMFPEPFRD